MQSLMPPIDSADSLFHDGNPLTGTQGTIVDAAWLNAVQSAIRDSQGELITLLAAANMTPDSTTSGQVLTALRLIMRASNTNFYSDTGTANNLVIQPAPAMTALVDGQSFDISCAFANTGAVTLKVSALSAFPVISSAGALQGGEIGAANGIIQVIWSAAKNSFLLMAQNTAGPFAVAKATKANHAAQLAQVLQVGNYLSEIAAAGAAAQQAAVANLGLSGDLPVGIPQPYFGATPPSGWIKCNGSTFSAAVYPKLALAYPSLVLPDLRGEFIRGWDDGRGVDASRTILSAQGDAMRKIVGSISNVQFRSATATSSDSLVADPTTGLMGNASNGGDPTRTVRIDTSLQAGLPIAAENRPRNIAFNYIVRAA